MDFPYWEPEHAQVEANVRVIRIAAKVDYGKLLQAARELAPLLERKYVEVLRQDLARAKLDLGQAEVLTRTTPYGEILIAGQSDNTYRDEKRQPAVLIDLGGNDFYAGPAATSGESRPLAIVVDREGNDAYSSNGDFAQGCGFLGVGMLADHAGNDRYLGQFGAQGCSFIGVGLLADAAGNDDYRADQLAQGVSFGGAAALIDGAGADLYEARLLAQGVAIAGSVGALIDGAGDDRYFAKGKFASDYSTPGTYNGLSQGVGFGLRGLAPGGIGILHDRGGRDRYEAGDFSQGGGHYFGWGILKDGGRDADRYIGSRYNQGFTAHYALATFVEEGGNDRYATDHFVATGISMDIASTWFEDRGGDDVYATQDFSVGSSAHNSLTVWIDRGGNDAYLGPEPRAKAQGNYYHGGTSLSLVMDLGGGTDRYSHGRNGAMEARDDYIFTFDAPGSLESLATPAAIRAFREPMRKRVGEDPALGK